MAVGFTCAFFLGFALLCVLLCLGWLLLCGALRHVSKGVKWYRQKVEGVKKRRRERREQMQADLDVERAAANKHNETIKATELEQKDEVNSVTAPVEKDSRWVKIKSWFGGLVWRLSSNTEDLEQDGMEMKEAQKKVQVDSNTEDDEPVIVVQEGLGVRSVQTWSPI